jgi:hypothetical protein
MMNTLVLHPRKQGLFAVLSLMDLTLTWWLLGHTNGVVAEGNPVASWWLARFGWHGLAGFKIALMLLLGAIVAVISFRQPRAGGGVLIFGCAILLCVILYSGWLCCVVPLRCADESASAINREWAEDNRTRAAFWALRTQLAEDLIAENCSLEEATTRLAACERLQDDDLRRNQAALYPGRPLLERLAANLINQVVLSLRSNPRHARQMARRLEKEFRLAYRSTPPPYPALNLLPGSGHSVPGEPEDSAEDRRVERV